MLFVEAFLLFVEAESLFVKAVWLSQTTRRYWLPKPDEEDFEEDQEEVHEEDPED